MKTFTIRQLDVEAAMLVEVQKRNWEYGDLCRILAGAIRDAYAKVIKVGRLVCCHLLI